MANRDTRDRLVRTAFDMFFDRGYNATGVGEIVAAIGVPKGSFYTYFASKDALACEVIDTYWAQGAKRLSRLAQAADSPVSCLRTHFRELRDKIVASDFRRGCLIGNFSAEMADQSETMRARLSAAFGGWQAAIADLIERARAQGEIASVSESAELAAILLNTFEGAILRARADRSRAPFDQFDKVFETLLGLKAAYAGDAPRH
jgi:TetR/AcrR family transcriptional regulator, transcriptional repressor for nem operon